MDEVYLKQLFLQLNTVIRGLGIQLSPWSRCGVVLILSLTLFPTHLTLLVSLFVKILWNDWLCYTFMLLKRKTNPGALFLCKFCMHHRAPHTL